LRYAVAAGAILLVAKARMIGIELNNRISIRFAFATVYVGHDHAIVHVVGE
jgi:hypothetical protein